MTNILKKKQNKTKQKQKQNKNQKKKTNNNHHEMADFIPSDMRYKHIKQSVN